MSDDERKLRFENAMATLAEMVAQHNERVAAAGRSDQMIIGLSSNRRQRIAHIEEAFVKLDELFQSYIETLKRRRRRR